MRNRNIKHSDQRGWKLTPCWVQAQRQRVRRRCHSPGRPNTCQKKPWKKSHCNVSRTWALRVQQAWQVDEGSSRAVGPSAEKPCANVKRHGMHEHNEREHKMGVGSNLPICRGKKSHRTRRRVRFRFDCCTLIQIYRISRPIYSGISKSYWRHGPSM